MSGIVTGINYNLLFSGESSSDATASILAALYSGTSSTTPTTTFVSSGNPITDLKLAQSEQTTGVAAEAKQPPGRERHHRVHDGGRQRHQHPDRPAEPGRAKGIAHRERPHQLYRRDGAGAEGPAVRSVRLQFAGQPVGQQRVAEHGPDLQFCQERPGRAEEPARSYRPSPMPMRRWSGGRASTRQTPGLANALTFLGQASAIKYVRRCARQLYKLRGGHDRAWHSPDDRFPVQDGTGARSTRISIMPNSGPELRHQPDRPVFAHHAGERCVQHQQWLGSDGACRASQQRPGGLIGVASG